MYRTRKNSSDLGGITDLQTVIENTVISVSKNLQKYQKKQQNIPDYLLLLYFRNKIKL